MEFLRILKSDSIKKMTTGKNAVLFERLKIDVLNGDVFPAIRNNELHFYYKGGCLYKFAGGSFARDSRYGLYGEGTAGLPPYEKAKKENENKFTAVNGQMNERQLLDKLYCHTYSKNAKSNVVVLDIEVNLNGAVGRGKKCDMVLLNTQTCEIMFVEGKVFADRRVKCAVGYTPEVIGQVNGYTAAIAEQYDNIIWQYGEYVRIVNMLFDAAYSAPNRLIQPAKLIVYNTGGGKAENVDYTVNIINKNLGAGNVMWVGDNKPTLNEIWQALKGE